MKATSYAPIDRCPDDFEVGSSVASCEAHIRRGFLRKVFGIVAAQLLLTGAMCAVFMFHPAARAFILSSPNMVMLSFFASMGFLFGAHAYKDKHPTNLQLTFGFTAAMSWSMANVCAQYYASGLGWVIAEAVLLTGSVTAALTAYTLTSKRDFSYMGAGLFSCLWVLIVGGLVAMLTASPVMHFALSVGGAALFSMYIVYDVFLIANRLGPDEYIPAAISLYLDIINLFLYILRILSSNRD